MRTVRTTTQQSGHYGDRKLKKRLEVQRQAPGLLTTERARPQTRCWRLKAAQVLMLKAEHENMEIHAIIMHCWALL